MKSFQKEGLIVSGVNKSQHNNKASLQQQEFMAAGIQQER